MLRIVRWALIPAVLVGWLLAGGIASAAVPEVKDEARILKPETLRKANAIIREIHDLDPRGYTDLYIETYPTVPGGEAKAEQVRKMSKSERERFFTGWLGERARELRVNGIYALICMKP